MAWPEIPGDFIPGEDGVINKPVKYAPEVRERAVRLDVTLSDRVVDLVEEGYDLAIRIAKLPSSTLISKRLASTRIVLCASPQISRPARSWN
jgi:DNA-binding transcriptional LysR family regulator